MHDVSWDDLRILLAVHRHTSFLAAGKALGLATSTVARRIDAFERGLGRKLLHRTTHGTRLDPSALDLVTLAESLELGLETLRRDARDEPVAGVVRLSVSEGFVRPAARLLTRLRARYPALAMEIISESRMADLTRHEADIGVRIARSGSTSLVEKLVGKATLGLFASRAYVERRLPGAILERASAGQQDYVSFDRPLERMTYHQWLVDYGATRFALRTSSAHGIEQAVISGVGIGVLEERQGAALGLVQLGTEHALPPVSIYIAYHRDAKKLPRVRVVVRELEAEIRRGVA